MLIRYQLNLYLLLYATTTNDNYTSLFIGGVSCGLRTAVVWQPVNHLELLQSYLVNLVNNVDCRDVHTAALNHINQVVNIIVVTQVNVGVVNSGGHEQIV